MTRSRQTERWRQVGKGKVWSQRLERCASGGGGQGQRGARGSATWEEKFWRRRQNVSVVQTSIKESQRTESLRTLFRLIF